MAKAAINKLDRREHIARALYLCISNKGYANTSLKDIAEQAQMSPSHLGYYYDNKAAILEDYAERICLNTLDALPDLDSTDAHRLIETLAAFCLGPGQMSLELSGVIQEITGLAVHDTRLNKIKAQHSKDWHNYLTQFFMLVPPRKGLNTQAAAWQLHASIVGLNTNLLYDKGLNRAQALELLCSSMYFLTGLKQKKAIGAQVSELN